MDASIDRPVQSPEYGYVSSDKCRACHPSEYNTWHGSYHRTMTQIASPSTVVAPFDGQTIEGSGLKYQLRSRDNQLIVEVDPRLGQPRERRVVITTGSHHMQAIWMATPNGNRVELVQSVYLFAEKRWVPRSSVFLIPPGGARVREFWNDNCIHCHSTFGQPRTLPRLWDTKVAEFGIACEACHGPARRHVRRHRRPFQRYLFHLGKKQDSTILHPNRLSPRLSSQICGFCHAYGDHRTETKSGIQVRSNYRPGGELPQGVAPPQPWIEEKTIPPERDAHLWPDAMVRGSGREYSDLIQSPCFKHGREKDQMGCLSCHAMHQPADDPRVLRDWANDQLKPGMAGDEGCLQCHALPDIAVHTHHPPESSGSRCYNCHAPYTTYGLLKAIRTHLNTNPSVVTTLTTGRPNACNLCHLDKSLGWTADHLAQRYGAERPRLTEDQERIASSILHLLSGDARQRALIAWNMGWEPARHTSGSKWLSSFLAQLLEDPYDVVRYDAYHSLRKLPEFRDFQYDFVGPPHKRKAVRQRVDAIWMRLPKSDRSRNAMVLSDSSGDRKRDVFDRLLRARNDRAVAVIE